MKRAKVRERTDDVWGETIIITPYFDVLGKTVEIVISEKYLSLWIHNGDGSQTIKNLKELVN